VALQASLKAKETALAQLTEAQQEIQEKVKEEIAKGEIALSQSGGRLRVDMVDRLLFDSGDARISKRGEGVLARVGAALAKLSDRQIQVLGHTDNQPIKGKLRRQFASNWELSAGRALNVVRFLQQRAQVPGERLVASGHGESQPIASNQTAAGRARNRRIEILLTPALEPEPMGKDRLELGAPPPLAHRGRSTAPRR
jgi:chemotaxis protein MotB